jgi:hypothetical protein
MAMAKLNGAANKPATNIWQVMNYQVPRGKCVHKVSTHLSLPSRPLFFFLFFFFSFL